MLRFNLLDRVEQQRLAEHERYILETPAKELGAAGRLTPKARALLLTRVRVHGWPVRRAAAAAGICVQSAYKLLARRL